MTDILLVVIILIMLLQIHATQKNFGRYGQIYVFIKKRIIRRILRIIKGRSN